MLILIGKKLKVHMNYAMVFLMGETVGFIPISGHLNTKSRIVHINYQVVTLI